MNWSIEEIVPLFSDAVNPPLTWICPMPENNYEQLFAEHRQFSYTQCARHCSSIQIKF
jgi:hypothetical protein